jgi:hypothetical protein
MMLQELAVVIANNAKQQIERDPEGHFRLCWDNRVLQLSPEQLAQLNRLLEEGVFDLFLKEVRICDYCLEQDKPGHFWLSLGETKLDLALMDFLKLVMLVRKAARRQVTSAYFAPHKA